MRQGLIHLYHGEGKGKTTAAMGLALRALGHHMRVVVLQFCKDGTSGELAPLKRLGATVLAGSPDSRFASELLPSEREALRQRQNKLLREVHGSRADLLVLDEACFAAQSGLVDTDLLKTVVLNRPANREIILTGRNPLPWMLEAADYVSELHCLRHPFERGIPAREGIEL